MQATDGGTPPRTDTTVVTVDVQRNLKAPVFSPSNYPTKLLETQPVGVPFVQVKAKDEDQKVSVVEVKLPVFMRKKP